ncbi:MAG: hypothetical protein HY246_03585 [Proteobacteria bacterium]|nr:hypothetical protein [Pseudomonadota bacterium]
MRIRPNQGVGLRGWLGYVVGALVFFAIAASPAHAQKTLTVGVAGFPDSLKTGWSSFTALTLSIQTNDPLVTLNNQGQVMPALATKWEAVNATTWRFHLRPGVKFHDGHPLTADDVKYTIDYVLDPKTVYGTASRINLIAKVDVIDPLTVEFVTKQPFPTLLVGLTNIVIEPKHYHVQSGHDAMTKHPIGTGPFVFLRWVPADRYELRLNPEYWGGKPKIDRLIFRQIPESATRISALLAGEVQIIEEIPTDLIDRVRKSSNAEVSPVETSGSLVLTFETRKPPFNDPRLRLAVDLAIDKDLINRQILGGVGSVLDGQLVTKATFGHNPNIKARPFDPGRAKRLIAEAGYPNGLTTTITTRSGRYVSDVEICNAIAGMLEAVGIKTSINVVEGGVYSKMATARDLGPMHLVGWYSLGDADFNAVWFTEATQRNFWVNDEYEKLFLAARSTVNRDERLKGYQRMMEIMHAENPSVFLFGLPSVYGKSKRLTGWVAPQDRLIHVDKAELR